MIAIPILLCLVQLDGLMEADIRIEAYTLSLSVVRYAARTNRVASEWHLQPRDSWTLKMLQYQGFAKLKTTIWASSHIQ